MSRGMVRQLLRAARKDSDPFALEVLKDYLRDRGINPERYEPAPLTLDSFAEIVGVPPYDVHRENNWEYLQDRAWEMLDPDEREDDGKREAAEVEVEADFFSEYQKALVRAAERALEDHGLVLTPISDWEYAVMPEKSWRRAATQVLETINGVGYFSFSSLADFLSSGPYTPREAVLEHLHWIKRYPEVYGTTPYRRVYEQGFR